MKDEFFTQAQKQEMASLLKAALSVEEENRKIFSSFLCKSYPLPFDEMSCVLYQAVRRGPGI